MTQMRVFLDCITDTYESANQAAEDLCAKGFPINSVPKQREPTLPTFSWKKAMEKRSSNRGDDYRERIKEKLSHFHHRAAGNHTENT